MRTLATLTILVVVGLVALLAWDPRLAGRLTSENNLLEWIQTILFLGAAVLSGRGAVRRIARGQPAAPDILLTFLFTTLFIGEVNLDRRLFGTKVIYTRFFIDERVWLPYRLLAGLVIGGTPVAVGVYALRHRWQVVDTVLGLAHERWGRIFIAGVVIFFFAQIFEHQLDYLFPQPEYFVEESLELIGAIYSFVAMIERTRFTQGPSDDEWTAPHPPP